MRHRLTHLRNHYSHLHHIQFRQSLMIRATMRIDRYDVYLTLWMPLMVEILRHHRHAAKAVRLRCAMVQRIIKMNLPCVIYVMTQIPNIDIQRLHYRTWTIVKILLVGVRSPHQRRQALTRRPITWHWHYHWGKSLNWLMWAWYSVHVPLSPTHWPFIKVLTMAKRGNHFSIIARNVDAFMDVLIVRA